MCWKQFSVYANAPRRILTLTNIRFVWKAGTGLKIFPQMIASPRYWKTEGAPSSEMRQTHTQTPLLSNQLHLHLELEAHSGGRLAAGFEVPLSNPPPAWREQKTASYSTAKKKKKGTRLCVKHPSIPPSPPSSLQDIFAYALYLSVLQLFVCAVSSSLAWRTGQLYWMSESVYTVALMLTSLPAGEQGSDVC